MENQDIDEDQEEINVDLTADEAEIQELHVAAENLRIEVELTADDADRIYQYGRKTKKTEEEVIEEVICRLMRFL